MVQDFGRRQDRSAKGLVHSRRASKAGIDDSRLLDTHLTSRGIHESRKDAIEQRPRRHETRIKGKSMQVHVMASKHLVFPQARGCKSAPSAMVSVRSVLLPFPLPCGGSNLVPIRNYLRFQICVSLYTIRIPGHVFRWVIATVVSLTRAVRHVV